jgi:hypothetical protein
MALTTLDTETSLFSFVIQMAKEIERSEVEKEALKRKLRKITHYANTSDDTHDT